MVLPARVPISVTQLCNGKPIRRVVHNLFSWNARSAGNLASCSELAILGEIATSWKTICSSLRRMDISELTHLSWAASSRQVMTSSKSLSFFLQSTLFRCPANRCASSAGNSCPSRDVILTSLTLSLPASASKKSSKYLGSDPRSTWNTTSSASSVQAGLSRILAHPSSSRGDVCTNGAGGRSLGAGPNPGPAPTRRQTAEILPSDAPAAFSNENTALGGTSSGHNWFRIRWVLGPSRPAKWPMMPEGRPSNSRRRMLAYCATEVR